MNFEANEMAIMALKIKKHIIPPAGWVTVEEDIEDVKKGAEDEDEKFVIKNLPLAIFKAEALVSEIAQETDIRIEESYLKISNDMAFHFVFLTSGEDFHSPEMALVHIYAEKHAKKGTNFDIHFSFSVLKEFVKGSIDIPKEYILKRSYH